jgi:cysteinyl-tRNA synthetase
VKKGKTEFGKAMDDDLNLPEALSAVFEFVRKANKTGPGKKAMAAILDFDVVLGLQLGEAEQWLPPEKARLQIKQLIKKREDFRKDKKWKQADAIRNQLKKKGIILEDTEKGPRWKQDNG